MTYDLNYWVNYFTIDETKRFDVDKNMLKVLIVNQNSNDAIFNYYNFDNLKEVLNFIKVVVLPSTALSSILGEYGEIFRITLDYDDFTEYIKNLKFEKKEFDKYKTLYEQINILDEDNISIRNIIEVTENMNFTYGNKNDVFSIVEFADCLKTYLCDIYTGYEKINDNFETLGEKFQDSDFTLDDFFCLLENQKSMDQDELEEFLYEIPII